MQAVRDRKAVIESNSPPIPTVVKDIWLYPLVRSFRQQLAA
jgi:hypothetical protein